MDSESSPTGPQMTSTFRPIQFWLVIFAIGLTSVLPAEDAPHSFRDTHRTQIVQRALQSSVNIHTEKRQKSLDVVFSAGKGSKINGMGSGIVIDERGYIVTNNHVVQDIERLRVTTYDGNEYEGRVLAFDSQKDLAIIKIDPVAPLIVAEFGSSSDLMWGEDVVAIGNAFGYESTVTCGVVSHKSRDVEVNEDQSYENLIQIDAAINPGNSGGPLINADGEIIGINVAIRAGAQRIGFAIPIDDARITIAQLINIERHHHTYHGIRATDYKNGADRRLIVQSILPGSPASSAGIVDGDVIVKSGNVKVADATDFERSLFGKRVGEIVDILVMRNGREQSLTLTVGALSGDQRVVNRQAPRPTIPPEPVNVPQTELSNSSRIWQFLGVKLESVTGTTQLPKPYNGGLQVVEIRPQGPALSRGIRPGDILVGLDKWETVKTDDIEYALDHHHEVSRGPLKFYILRDGETLYGEIPLTLSQR